MADASAAGGPAAEPTGPAPDAPDAGPEEQTGRVKHSTLIDAPAEAVPAEGQSATELSLLGKTTWDELRLPPALKAAVVAQHWERPSIIQALSIPAALRADSPHVVGQAIGGSGKTGAFALISLMKVNPTLHTAQVIVVEPTRMLAIQQADVIRTLAAPMGVTVQAIVGGGERMPPGTKVSAHIVVCTDGKLQELIRTGAVNPAAVHTFVMDEADELLSVDRRDVIMQPSMRLKQMGNPQILLFSASFGCMQASAPAIVKSMVQTLLPTTGPSARPIVPITIRTNMNPNVHHFEVPVETASDDPSIKPQTFEAKVRFLHSVLSEISQPKVLIFVEENATAYRVADRLKELGVTSTGVVAGKQKDGSRTSNEKNAEVLNKFRANAFNVCIATDALGRGIDIPGLKIVVNFNMPVAKGPNVPRGSAAPNLESFQHRCARVGRLGQGKSGSGVCIHMLETATEARVFALLKSHFTLKSEPLPQDASQAALMVDGAANKLADQTVDQTVDGSAYAGHTGAAEYKVSAAAAAGGGPGGHKGGHGGHAHGHGHAHGGKAGGGGAGGGAGHAYHAGGAAAPAPAPPQQYAAHGGGAGGAAAAYIPAAPGAYTNYGAQPPLPNGQPGFVQGPYGGMPGYPQQQQQQQPQAAFGYGAGGGYGQPGMMMMGGPPGGMMMGGAPGMGMGMGMGAPGGAAGWPNPGMPGAWPGGNQYGQQGQGRF